MALRVPATNARGPLYIEQVLDALHQRGSCLRQFRLEIAPYQGEVRLFCRFAQALQPTLMRELHAAYPDARIEELPDAALTPPAGTRQRRLCLALQPKFGAIRTWQEFRDPDEGGFADPLAGLLNALADPQSQVRVVIAVRPLPGCWLRLRHPRSTRQPSLEKFSRKLFSVTLTLFAVTSAAESRITRRKLRDVAATFARYTGTAALFRRCLFPRRFYLSTPELAGLWHPPTRQVRTEQLATVGSRQLEPPAGLPAGAGERGLAVLGRVAFRGRREICGMRGDDRLRHLYLIGKTGMGKTTLLESQARSDIEAGQGLLYLDPHGDSAERLADAIPPRRTNDVIYFDPADYGHPIGLNLLACPNPADRPKLASEIVSILQHLYGLDPSNAPRLLDITRNALLALMEVPGTTLLSVVRMLGDRPFRQAIVARVSDPIVRQYWEQEFGRWKPAEQTLAVAAVQNKLRPFIIDYRLRYILGQEQNRLDLRQIMDEGKILIANLSKGKLGESTAALIGSVLVTKLQLAAMSRADVAEEKRRPFFAYVDEFQNFATESFATILSEARKYKLALTVSHQYLAQLDRAQRDLGNDLKASIFGNVGSIVAFQVGPDDAACLAEQFGGGLLPEDFMSLPKYMAYARLLIDGLPSRPFSIETLQPGTRHWQHRLPVIRRTTQRRYGQPLEKVQAAVSKAMQVILNVVVFQTPWHVYCN
ncbi:MAG: type IV secretory system conjugative DNA transfer family protein [Planctomycetales bacterium]